MRRLAIYLFCVLSLADFSAIPASSEEATSPAPTISRWTKFCLGETCFIGADIRTECETVASVALIAQSGGAKVTLKIGLPPHVKRERGASFAIDQAVPILRPFDACSPGGCSASYEAGSDLVDQLKHGQTLAVMAVDGDGSAIHRLLPLAGFAEAYDSPSTPPKVIEEQQAKLSDELQRRADEARQRTAHEQEPHKTGCPSQQ